jgi:phytoene dehydrogenase-like protein
MSRDLHSAVVVGAGPNGLAAAITLQRAGIQVLLLEGHSTVGGGMRTAELTLPGFKHDVCSAIHPMAALAPFFKTLPLEKFGLEFIDPPVLAAHPFDDGHAAVLLHSFEETAKLLGSDGDTYRRFVGDLIPLWPDIADDVLGPLGIPSHPIDLARFGFKALLPATALAKFYHSQHGKGLFAGMAAHSMQPLSKISTSAIALVLSVAGHLGGWPIPKGGSQTIADAMAQYFRSLGGVIETGVQVNDLDELSERSVVLLDVGPRQLLKIAGSKLSGIYCSRLKRFRYGPGIFKVDWALDGPIPFSASECLEAGTVHLGGTLQEIEASEEDADHGRVSERPFILLAQQSRFDRSRVPDGKETAWAYCHVPNGSTVDMTEAIERQIERFAPGFRDRILARHTMGPSAMETYNPNYVGGDINGGAMDISQIFARPIARISPYKTSAPGIYLCSASTPPGGGVHGHCGYHAARQALRDHFPDCATKNN